MLRYGVFAVTTMAAVVLTGCATTTENGDVSATAVSAAARASSGPSVTSGVQPDWLTGESEEYPRMDYLTARGSGPDAGEAIQDAQNRIKGLFEVSVGDGDPSFTPLTDPLEALSQSLAELQSDIQVATVWRDNATEQYHALAVAPRKPAETYLHRAVNDIDTRTGELLDQAKAADSKIAKLGFLAQAWYEQSARTHLQASLQKADLTGKGVPPRWKEKKINSDTSKQLKRLKIMPVEHDKYPLLESLTEGLNTAGLSPAKQGNAEYMIQASLTMSVSQPKSGWTQGQGKLEVSLVDKTSMNTVGKRNWDIKVDALDAIAAGRRVLEKADFYIKKDMRDFLINVAITQP